MDPAVDAELGDAVDKEDDVPAGDVKDDDEAHHGSFDAPDDSLALTPEREAVLQAVTRRVEKHQLDAAAITRFCIARQWDEEKIVEMIDNHIVWRAATFPIKIEDVREELLKGKFFACGKDKAGRPIIIIRAKFFDPKTRDLDKSLKASIFLLEHVIKKMDAKSDGKFLMIYDRTDFNMRKNLDLDLTKAIAGTLGANYPERLYKSAISPAGGVFRSIWKVAKLFFDERTRAKVCPMKNFSQLKAFIDDDNLLVAYGGTLDYKFDGEQFLRELES
jgi:hypothetical protein